MEVLKNVHQIRIDFQVTESVKRYVYVYLITGKSCCLIDSGVAGSEKIIENYMRGIGRDMKEITAVFLTHAHPDHIGGAAAVKRASGCKVYVSGEEKGWVSDISLQFQERPIPNFYSLVEESVPEAETVREGDQIVPEAGITLQVLETKGHSDGSVSYLFQEEGVLFCGDAIPEQHDFPIFTDVEESRKTLERLGRLNHIKYCCPAWDHVYGEKEWKEKVTGAGSLLRELQSCVRKIQHEYPEISDQERAELTGNKMGWKNMAVNPLFLRSITSVISYQEIRSESSIHRRMS